MKNKMKQLDAALKILIDNGWVVCIMDGETERFILTSLGEKKFKISLPAN